jgi:hypothetical protein
LTGAPERARGPTEPHASLGNGLRSFNALAEPDGAAYVICMSRTLTTTVRLDADDAEALRKARADGEETSELIRRGLRIVAARYYAKRRPPRLNLFRAVDPKLGDESELFGDLQK